METKGAGAVPAKTGMAGGPWKAERERRRGCNKTVINTRATKLCQTREGDVRHFDFRD